MAVRILMSLKLLLFAFVQAARIEKGCLIKFTSSYELRDTEIHSLPSNVATSHKIPFWHFTILLVIK